MFSFFHMQKDAKKQEIPAGFGKMESGSWLLWPAFRDIYI